MSKLATLSFTNHEMVNYGAILQSLSLKRCIEVECNTRVDVINYKNDKKSSFLSKAYKIYKLLLGDRLKSKRCKDFLREYLGVMPPFVTPKDIELKLRDYECIVYGSDQIWNPLINNRNACYFGAGTSTDSAKYSYSASFGLYSVDDEAYMSELVNSLSHFDGVSVREKTGQAILQKYNISSRVDIDPVFLTKVEDWRAIERRPKQVGPSQRFLLCYIMPGDSDLIASLKRDANEIAKKRDLSVFYVGEKDFSKYRSPRRTLYGVGPREWLWLIDHADYILTNSFHGTAFSVIYERPFFSYFSRNNKAGNKFSSRIVDLLNMLGLSGQVISDLAGNVISLADWDRTPDFDNARLAIERERSSSAAYVRSFLHDFAR